VIKNENGEEEDENDQKTCVEDHAFAPARLPDQGEAKPIEE